VEVVEATAASVGRFGIEHSPDLAAKCAEAEENTWILEAVWTVHSLSSVNLVASSIQACLDVQVFFAQV
jgi:hypothetical protein